MFVSESFKKHAQKTRPRRNFRYFLEILKINWS